MKRYTVIFHPEAEKDIRASLEWGIRTWGNRQALQWLLRLRSAIKKRLIPFPESCPLAPESSELDIEVRQIVVDRYRVLFTLRGNTVTILYVKGAYSGIVIDEGNDQS